MTFGNESKMSEEEYLRLRLEQIGMSEEKINCIVDKIIKKSNPDNND